MLISELYRFSIVQIYEWYWWFHCKHERYIYIFITVVHCCIFAAWKTTNKSVRFYIISMSKSNDPKPYTYCSSCEVLTIFAVYFDRVGGKLKSRATPVRLRKPEVLHLTIGTQHVHFQHWERREMRGKREICITHRQHLKRSTLCLIEL